MWPWAAMRPCGDGRRNHYSFKSSVRQTYHYDLRCAASVFSASCLPPARFHSSTRQPEHVTTSSCKNSAVQRYGIEDRCTAFVSNLAQRILVLPMLLSPFRRPLQPQLRITMTTELTKSQELIARRKNAVPNGVGMFNHCLLYTSPSPRD